MSLHLFRHLRRCRALFALALCAWLAMGSAVWAKSDCCASMDMHASMALHADHHAQHSHGQPEGNSSCTCAHAAVDRLMAEANAADSTLPDRIRWQPLLRDAPQRPFAPPLRPPSA
jgi:hypothetical protein